MQPKVSMVVPCYNKEKYIGDMLHSVCRQAWNNIEVILVNDGSTDGTREAIAVWEPRLRERGYEVVIIDQENAGCCAAVYHGMLRMTGEYFCLVDCDDEIMPEYVSRMAGWLEDNPEYDLAACTYVMYKGTAENQHFCGIGKRENKPDEPGFLENFLLTKTLTPAWIYMSRRERANRIIEHFYTERIRTYEPCIVIPLAFGKAKVKFFNEALYKFNLYANGFVGFENFEQVNNFYNDYAYQHEWVISRLDIGEKEKEKLIAFGKLGCLRQKNHHTIQINDNKNKTVLAKLYLEFINEYFRPLNDSVVINNETVLKDTWSFHRAVENNVLGVRPKTNPGGRIIAWGAMGKRAGKLLPVFVGTLLEPDELWDAAGDGIKIKKPDTGSLSANDMVIVFPVSEPAEQIYAELVQTGCSIMMRDDIDVFIRSLSFPQFYDGSLTFVPGEV
jgi:glycosyltransferase involved in cell wall biosynthesis